MNRRTLWGMLAIGALSLAACDDPITPEPRSVRSTLASSAQRDDRKGGDGLGGVFTSSNASSGNVVFAFARHADGTLTKAGEFPAGGDGIGGGVDPLQSENSVVLGRDRRRLYVVNAGSNSVTTFAVSPNATLQSLATVSSGGEGPISLASTGNHLFVLNSDNSIVELTLGADGVPQATARARISLGDAADGPSTIAASRDGELLFVTQRSANAIDVVRADKDGAFRFAGRHASSGAVPFGFAVTNRGQLVVSEAAGDAPNGAASSYSVTHDGTLSPITSSASTHQAAACWLVLSNNGAFAFVANAGSGSITGYAVESSGLLRPLDASGRTGVTTTTDATPLDMATSGDGKLLYVLQTGTGTIGAFRIGADGRLTTMADTPGLTAAAGFQGLAAY